MCRQPGLITSPRSVLTLSWATVGIEKGQSANNCPLSVLVDQGLASPLRVSYSYGSTQEAQAAWPSSKSSSLSNILPAPFSQALPSLDSPMQVQQESEDAAVIVQHGDNVVSKRKELHQPGHCEHCSACPQPLLQQSSHIQDWGHLGGPGSVRGWGKPSNTIAVRLLPAPSLPAPPFTWLPVPSPDGCLGLPPLAPVPYSPVRPLRVQTAAPSLPPLHRTPIPAPQPGRRWTRWLGSGRRGEDPAGRVGAGALRVGA